MEELVPLKSIISSLIFSGIGLLVFTVCFVLLEVITPKVCIWKEIVEKQNVALAILMGAVTYGIATIIASAIHG